MSENVSSARSKEDIGKVRANWVGSEYIVFDHGLNPENSVVESQIRKELGVIAFEYDHMGPGTFAQHRECFDSIFCTYYVTISTFWVAYNHLDITIFLVLYMYIYAFIVRCEGKMRCAIPRLNSSGIPRQMRAQADRETSEISECLSQRKADKVHFLYNKKPQVYLPPPF